MISIHAPRGGSDRNRCDCYPSRPDFNPRSPWGERHSFTPVASLIQIFQSTLPVGGATGQSQPPEVVAEFQSTLPVGGATVLLGLFRGILHISIHAPRGGSDMFLGLFRVLFFIFQSTLPVGGATYGLIWNEFFRDISIHAPRGGSDSILPLPMLLTTYFNPRSPWGERLQRCTVLGAHLWRRYIIFAHFREIWLSAWAASGESGGKQRSKSRANLPGIFCLPGLRNQRIRGASGI